VAIEGEVKQSPAPTTWTTLLKLAPMEERIYRLRCVEGWSMVIPWVGYSLAELIKRVEPTGNAKFVQFVTLADKAQMPGLRSSVLDWPYVEGLRLDEAMHPLTLLAFGMYGEVLPNQNGAPLRLVVPWKYGFKSGKSIVKIRFVDKQPKTSWEAAAIQRVRLLFQRQPASGPPALEPGHRAPHRRRRPVCQEAADADVQRLRAPGRAALRRHGPEEVLLTRDAVPGQQRCCCKAARPSRCSRAAKPCCSAGLGPWWLLMARWPTRWAPTRPSTLIRSTGDWTLRFLCLTLAVTPLRQATGWHALARLRRMLGCSAFFYGVLHFLCFAWLDMGLDLARSCATSPSAPSSWWARPRCC
jgi:hypothetical protein